jgi:transketolase
MIDYSRNLRHVFAKEIYSSMKTNKRIIVLTGDLGYGMWDTVRQDFPTRFVNVGAAEQALIGIAIGFALNGLIPITYSITPFLLYRPFETIRNYLNHENIPVKLIGSGRDRDYIHDGFSHWAQEDKKVMNIFKNIVACWPENVDELLKIIPKMLHDGKPWYINLKR